MGTRTGDLDPGLLIYLLTEEGYNASQLEQLVHHQSSLLGVSGLSPGMRTLLERRAIDGHAAQAVERSEHRPPERVMAAARAQLSQTLRDAPWPDEVKRNIAPHPFWHNILDWWHLTQKLTVLDQYGKGLVHCDPVLGEEIRDKID